MKVSIPKGMRDFSPAVMAKRNYIFDTIKKSFQTYGFEQIETPTIENRETLTGKYGDEGDSLIFNVMQRGDKLVNEVIALKNLDELTSSELTVKNFNPSVKNKIVNNFTDGALRYDLTVPFAR